MFFPMIFQMSLPWLLCFGFSPSPGSFHMCEPGRVNAFSFTVSLENAPKRRPFSLPAKLYEAFLFCWMSGCSHYFYSKSFRSCFESWTAILSNNEVPFGVNTRPLWAPFSVCLIKPDFSNCWRIFLICDPAAL